MYYIKNLKLPYTICVILTFVSTLVLWVMININYNRNPELVNKYGSELFLVPNVVHYIIFNQSTISFITYLSILSVLKVQKPTALYMHGNKKRFFGYYWEKLMSLKTNTTIHQSHLQQPTHVYGQLLSSVYHSSDVARIEILRQFGGIYVDTDVLVLKSLDPLRHFQMVVGWPDDMYVGTQVLMAGKPTPFLDMWLRGYQKYHPRDWYYNAGVVPTEILQTYRYLAHYENTSLGVQNLLTKLHSTVEWDWKDFYTIHLLSRHSSITRNATEKSVLKLSTNFGKIAQWILSL